MIKGFPIGYLMLWDCPALEKSKTIGIEKHTYATPKQVIIDGQQRLTSLYAVMKGKKVINSNYQEKIIIISYNPLLNKFEVGYQATKNDKEWIYNISDLFLTSSYKFISNYITALSNYRNSKGLELTSEEIDTIEANIQGVYDIKKYSLRVFEIKASADEEDVSEVFVRVNSGGITLKQNDFILTLLSLYWSEGRNLIEKFSKDSITPPTKDKITSYNHITEVSAQDIIRVLIAYAFDRARLQYGYKLLRGADFDKKGAVNEELRNNRFDIIKEKLPNVLDVHNWHEFLKSILNAGYYSGLMILSRTAIFYSYALYLITKYKFRASANENLHITSLWFFFALLTSLYSGSFESVMENHLNSIKDLQNLEDYKTFILDKINEKMTNDFFNITLVGSEGLAVSGSGNNAWYAYVASLIILNSKILFSKSSIPLAKLFEPSVDGNRKSLEKHHLFPKAYLKKQGYNDSKINQMANYAFIDWNDNMEVSDEAPSIYYKKICSSLSNEEKILMENENALPSGWENMDYEDFLVERRKLMAKKIHEAFKILVNNVK